MFESTLDDLVPLVRQVGMFSCCTDHELKAVATKAELRQVDEGERVITQGAETSELFLVLQGGAQAVHDGRVVATFGTGDHFGELAVLVSAPRTSDVVMTERSLVAVFERNTVYLLLDAIPGVAARMIEGLACSLRDRIVAD